MTFILAKEHDLNPLFLVNRIDKLTSGLVILGKCKEFASKVCKMIREGEINKCYIAKVDGRFNIGDLDEGIVEEPILVQDKSRGINIGMERCLTNKST